MGLQRTSRRVPGRPVHELPGRESFLAEPKALAVVQQDFDRRALAVAENESTAGHGIFLELLSADGCQAVDPFAEVHWLRGHQDAHGRAGLDHDATSLPHRVGSN